ncbi:MAG: NADH-quinone oxidoreductase subunit N [Chitinophagales bacterium]|nr:NADH-quinone oxidoreductase subunit N [Chitinophagales bacterium]MDW8393646.1 NADH-quinone oxidoreductase subunit N [Chitinophagales bacterium]
MSLLLCLTAFGVLAMIGSGFRWRGLIPLLSGLGLLAAAVLMLAGWDVNERILNGMLQLDNMALAFSLVVLLAALVTSVLLTLLPEAKAYQADLQALLLFALIGAVVMASFTHLLLLFLGIEILSLASYVFAGIRKRDVLSHEAALKYFLMGAFSSALLLLGIAFLYGATGSFDGALIAGQLMSQGGNAYVVAGIVLLLAGMFFKISAVPFQFWVPDVYQGAPTVVTGFLATAGKVAAFAALLRLLQEAILPAAPDVQHLLSLVVAATVLAGNLMAVRQTSVKRMLAFSSIAHAGYMLLGLVVLNSRSADALFFYSVAYVLSGLTAFAVLHVIESSCGGDGLEHFQGVARTQPGLAVAWTLAMLSLAGIPVTAGFIGKFYIFSSALAEGLVGLVVLAVIGSVISVYYYLRPVVSMFTSTGAIKPVSVPFSVQVLLLALSLLTLLFGIVPGWLAGIL